MPTIRQLFSTLSLLNVSYPIVSSGVRVGVRVRRTVTSAFNHRHRHCFATFGQTHSAYAHLQKTARRRHCTGGVLAGGQTAFYPMKSRPPAALDPAVLVSGVVRRRQREAFLPPASTARTTKAGSQRTAHAATTW